MAKILKCPDTIEKFSLLTKKQQIKIRKHNQQIADDHHIIFNQIANSSNKQLKKLLIEAVIDELKETVNQRIKYPWQERDIAARELLLMVIDIRNHYSLEMYCR